MKIKYLSNAPAGKKGDVKEVPDNQANVLIKLGLAEPYKAPVKRRKTKKETDESE